MSRTIHRTLETPSGLGEIRKAGQHIANVSYHLTVKQQINVTETFGEKEETEGLREISGQVIVSKEERMQSQVLSGMKLGETFTLHMSDGRRLEVFTSNCDTVKGIYYLAPIGSVGFVSD